ncbi:hypothetical protein HO173_007198 [Letharia columbiana]|uniref:Uncharacterized protein n=1 Tax=Letharia columbiana TaxID=112416 RepID=A0A8H6FTR1_9LECA|nr:uncharacterized protein HO173_007198 [Letharia columbiana]KAF6234572.1 hypothetical protein HO173_007198 [Letharia columbiana]
MASSRSDRETEAYFRSVMAGELHIEETVGVMMSPKFWDFLASTLSKHVRERLADEIGRRILDKEVRDAEHTGISPKVLEVAKAFPGGERRLQERDELFQALYASAPEGGKFEFLRDWFCGVVGREEQGEAGSGGEEEAEKENGNSEAQGPKVWEWTKSDSEAEHWLFEREAARARGVPWDWNERSLAEAGSVWEWTKYDSEAEREQAELKRF